MTAWLCYKTLALEAVDSDVTPEPDCINIVYEPTISSPDRQNFMDLQDMLEKMGIRINCRFLHEFMENIRV